MAHFKCKLNLGEVIETCKANIEAGNLHPVARAGVDSNKEMDKYTSTRALSR
jgi:hypothetical protein